MLESLCCSVLCLILSSPDLLTDVSGGYSSKSELTKYHTKQGVLGSALEMLFDCRSLPHHLPVADSSS